MLECGFVFILALCTFATGKDVLLEAPDCGHQIVDTGTELRGTAVEGEFPWAALLKYEGATPYKCVGSLINDRYVLTTAVCVTTGNHKVVGVVLGEHTIGESPHHEEYEIEKIIPHGNFSNKRGNVNHDIALIKLNARVKYSDYVKPICLPLKGSSLVKPEERTVLVGWKMFGGGPATTKTKKVVIRRAITNEECQLIYSSRKISISDDSLCTQSLKDYPDCTYAGDSGASVMVKSGESWYMDGILSFGASTCTADIPDVNVRVSKYVTWIQSILDQD